MLQESDTNQILYWGTTNVRWHRTKFSRRATCRWGLCNPGWNVLLLFLIGNATNVYVYWIKYKCYHLFCCLDRALKCLNAVNVAYHRILRNKKFWKVCLLYFKTNSVSRLKVTTEWVIPAATEPNFVTLALCKSDSRTNTKFVIFSVQKVRIL